jgi:acetylornithine deacetylase/succinyl-diaminopimelate desuccinylase-like protein
MQMRNDALCAASEFILEVERFAGSHMQQVLATVGTLNITHAASNVIPGEVSCTLDLRSANQAVLSSCFLYLQQLGEAICQRRKITFTWEPVQETNSVKADAGLNRLLAQSVLQAGYEVINLVSGAGHDAVAVAPVSPVAMLFVRCFKGISHNPLENVEEKDIAAAVKVSAIFIHSLIQKYNPGLYGNFICLLVCL